MPVASRLFYCIEYPSIGFLLFVHQTDCHVPQLHLLSLELSPALHSQCPLNCLDPIGWLPDSLGLHIMRYLDPGNNRHDEMFMTFFVSRSLIFPINMIKGFRSLR